MTKYRKPWKQKIQEHFKTEDAIMHLYVPVSPNETIHEYKPPAGWQVLMLTPDQFLKLRVAKLRVLFDKSDHIFVVQNKERTEVQILKCKDRQFINGCFDKGADILEADFIKLPSEHMETQPNWYREESEE